MAPNVELDFTNHMSEGTTTTSNVLNYLNQHSEVNLSKKRHHDDVYMSDDSFNNESNKVGDEKRGKKPGRIPINEDYYEEDDEDPKIKRKVQNRAAQRAFRERKERYVKELEKKVKFVQQSHVNATTKLHKENEQLRAIVFHLESQLSAVTGTYVEMPDRPAVPLIEKKPGRSWLASIGPSVPLSIINSFPSNPPPPLQIRPLLAMNNSRTSKKLISAASKGSDRKKLKPVNKNQQNNTQLSSNNDENQEFTFAITTPDTLRAHNENNSFKRNEVIQAVQLYPDHSHPANSLLEKMPSVPIEENTVVLSPVQMYTSSISSCDSVISSGGDEDSNNEDKKSEKYNVDQDNLVFTEELHDMLKPFFDSSSNDFYV